MIDIDSKPFSTAVIGVVTLVTCYVAGWTDWALVVLPLLVMVAFCLAFRSPAPPMDQPAMTRGGASVWATEPTVAHKGSIPARSGAVPAAGAGQAIELDYQKHSLAIDLTPAGKGMFQIMGVFAEFERAMIRERMKVGLERARAQGETLRCPTVGATTDARSERR
jgi:hypothetical protein